MKGSASAVSVSDGNVANGVKMKDQLQEPVPPELVKTANEMRDLITFSDITSLYNEDMHTIDEVQVKDELQDLISAEAVIKTELEMEKCVPDVEIENEVKTKNELQAKLHKQTEEASGHYKKIGETDLLIEILGKNLQLIKGFGVSDSMGLNKNKPNTELNVNPGSPGLATSDTVEENRSLVPEFVTIPTSSNTGYNADDEAIISIPESEFDNFFTSAYPTKQMKPTFYYSINNPFFKKKYKRHPPMYWGNQPGHPGGACKLIRNNGFDGTIGNVGSPLEIGGLQIRGIEEGSRNIGRPNQNYRHSRMMGGGYNNGFVTFVGTKEIGRGKGRGGVKVKGRTDLNYPFSRENSADFFKESSVNSFRDKLADLAKINDSSVSIKTEVKGAQKKKGRPRVQKNYAHKLKQSVVEVNETKNSPAPATTSVEESQRKRGRPRLRKNDILGPSCLRGEHVSSHRRQRQLLVWSGDSFNKVSSDKLGKRKRNKSVVDVELSESDSDVNSKTAKKNSAGNSDEEWEMGKDLTSNMSLNQKGKNYSYILKTGTHSPGCYKCEKCGNEYKYIRGLRLHQRYACTNKPTFTCCYCLKLFVYRHNLIKHVKKHHKDKYNTWLDTTGRPRVQSNDAHKLKQSVVEVNETKSSQAPATTSVEGSQRKRGGSRVQKNDAHKLKKSVVNVNEIKSSQAPTTTSVEGSKRKRGGPGVQKNDAHKLKHSVVEVNEIKSSPAPATTSVEGSQRKRGRPRLRKNDILGPSCLRGEHVSSHRRQRQLLVWSGDSFNKVSSDKLGKRKRNKSVVDVELSESDSDVNSKTAKKNSAENGDEEWEMGKDLTSNMSLNQKGKNYSYILKTGTHSPGCYKCEKCGNEYKYIRGLRLHQRYACTNKPTFTCCYCLKLFVYRHNLIKHVKKHHKDKYNTWLDTTGRPRVQSNDAHKLKQSVVEVNETKSSQALATTSVEGSKRKRRGPGVQKNDAHKLKKSVVNVNEIKSSQAPTTTSVEGSKRKRGGPGVQKNDILGPSCLRGEHVSSRGCQRQLLVWSGDSFNKVSSDELEKRKINKSEVDVESSESDSEVYSKTAKMNSAENSDEEWKKIMKSTTNQGQKNYSRNQKTGIHRPGRFECEKCGSQYKYIRELRLHKRYACSNKPKLTCCYCLLVTLYKHNLKRHVKTHHNNKYNTWLDNKYILLQ